MHSWVQPLLCCNCRQVSYQLFTLRCHRSKVSNGLCSKLRIRPNKIYHGCFNICLSAFNAQWLLLAVSIAISMTLGHNGKRCSRKEGD